MGLGAMIKKCLECNGVGQIEVDNATKNVDKDLNVVDKETGAICIKEGIQELAKNIEELKVKPKRKYNFKNKK